MSFYAQYDEQLSPEEQALVEKAQAFCDGTFSAELLQAYVEARPYSAEWIQRWAEKGFLGLQTKKAHGGHEASFLCKVRVAQAMAEHGFGAAFAINNLQGSVTRISRGNSDVQREHLMEPMRSGVILGAPAMTEPGAGSDLSSLQTTATAVAGGWLINGQKAWITNGMVIGSAALLAKVVGGTGDGELATFLAPMDNEKTAKREEIVVPGGRAFRLALLTFENHFVPSWAMYGEAGQAFKASLAAINAARVHVAAMCVAALHACLREAIHYCGSRMAFGKPLLRHQGLSWELAEVSIRLEAANALVFRAAKLINDGHSALVLAAQAKKFAVDTAIWGVDQCIRVMGAVGATNAHRLAMQAAEVRLSAYGDGTNEMLLDRIAKSLDKEYGEPGKAR